MILHASRLPERAAPRVGPEQILHPRSVAVFGASDSKDKFGGRITHFLIHANTSSADVCYLQDLFTASDVRGKGVARALIEAVADWARERKCPRVYWQTQESNATARLLYDKVAVNRGFIRYDIELGA